jgi:zinc/manganese transport system substrate-binding protein
MRFPIPPGPALAALFLLSLALAAPAPANAGPKVVASFSILADMTREIAGDRAEIAVLVGPGSDAHVFEPSPRHAAMVGGADLLVINGLGFEGWTERLVEAADFMGPVVIASKGITPLPAEAEGHEHHDEGDRHAHEEEEAEHDHGPDDPHAWQDLANARFYIANIADGLCTVDAGNCPAYRENAARYQQEVTALDGEIRTLFAAVPKDRRRLITSHDAFGYFARAYGLEMLAPVSSTGAEPSARDIAALIRQIREHGISALFVETITDPRLMEQIARETGAKVGGELYSDTLSQADGPAASYLEMMRHNMRVIAAALKP